MLTDDNPGRRFACPGLSATLGFQPALAKQETSAPLLSGENGAYKPTQDGLIPPFLLHRSRHFLYFPSYQQPRANWGMGLPFDTRHHRLLHELCGVRKGKG